MSRAGDVALLVLAAGKGTRMRSRLPKVLHPVCGRPILLHAVALGQELGAKRRVVVVGSGQDEVRKALSGQAVEIVEQVTQLGTAHAVLQARELLRDHPGPVLIMYGDHALYRASTMENLLDLYHSQKADLALLVGELPDPTGYGRIVRGPDGRIDRIVEETDASPEIRGIHEVNLGVYVAGADFLYQTLATVSPANEQEEFYLTDLVELTLEAGKRVETSLLGDWSEAFGINDRADLARVESILRGRIADHWMRQGVTLVDPDRTYLDVDVEIGPDTVIEPGCRLRGNTRIGTDCRIDPNVVIDASSIGNNVWVKPHCWIEQSVVGDGCVIGPSAHLRPNNVLAENVRIGNFVEVKNSNLGPGTKADHLSYIGDADIGARVTVACGVITVNYDGKKKSRTVIEDGSFVGCNSNLIAPVTLAPDSYVAAGSTITKDVPTDALAVARARQRNVEGWRKRFFAETDED
jgi:bifunctional UDP-N-acetylglucosamine pyrophosphorylase/glucosamine-1-phosphate N-acetyltransferase